MIDVSTKSRLVKSIESEGTWSIKVERESLSTIEFKSADAEMGDKNGF